MKIEYVGPKPRVDQHGIDFDKSEPDRYIFLYAVIELLEIIEECVTVNNCEITADGVVNIADFEGLTITSNELPHLVRKHCSENIQDIIDQKEQKTSRLLEALQTEVDQNTLLEADDKRAWLGNIAIMEEYYRQFVEKKVIYECLLEVLAHDIYKRKIKEIRFRVGKNYGFVFSYLQNVLAEHKPPLDASMELRVENGRTIGYFHITHPQTNSIS